jgi:hypothetical protein
MNLMLKVTKEPEDVDGTGNRFLATVEIFGVSHHLEFMRVEEAPNEDDGELEQRPVDPELQLNYEDLQGLFAGRYETFALPNQEGRFIAYMVPFED